RRRWAEQPPVPRDQARSHGPHHRRGRTRRGPRRRKGQRMSGVGAPSPTERIDGTGLRVIVIAGTWHDVITDGLIAGAERVLAASGASFDTVRVPGSFELAVAA